MMTLTFDLAATERSLSERRRFRRVPIQLPLQWSAPGIAHGSWIPAETLDASAGGACVLTELPPGVGSGTAVCVAIDLPERQIVALGEWCEIRMGPDESGRHEAALQFTALGRGDLRSLVRALVDFEMRAAVDA